MKYLICITLFIFCKSSFAQNLLMKDTEVLNEHFHFPLESYQTIDDSLSGEVFKILKKGMKEKDNRDVFRGQVVVMETKTGTVNACVSFKRKHSRGKMKRVGNGQNQCSTMPLKLIQSVKALNKIGLTLNDSIHCKFGLDSVGGLWIKDHNWQVGGFGRMTYREAFKLHSDVAMSTTLFEADSLNFQTTWRYITESPMAIDAITLAYIYSYIANVGNYDNFVEKTYIQGVLSETDCFLNRKEAELMREILKATLHEGGIGSKWTDQKYNLSGDYLIHRNCTPTSYDNGYTREPMKSYGQLLFIGYMPSENPRYTICVTTDRKDYYYNGRRIKNIVNHIAESLYNNK